MKKSSCEGRRAYYRLHDHHLPELLMAMRHHQEHVNPPAAQSLPTQRREEATS